MMVTVTVPHSTSSVNGRNASNFKLNSGLEGIEVCHHDPVTASVGHSDDDRGPRNEPPGVTVTAAVEDSSESELTPLAASSDTRSSSYDSRNVRLALWFDWANAQLVVVVLVVVAVASALVASPRTE